MPEPEQTRTPLTATIRHALYFSFQSQNEIISNKHLFHKMIIGKVDTQVVIDFFDDFAKLKQKF